jgi:hypothetical protein
MTVLGTEEKIWLPHFAQQGRLPLPPPPPPPEAEDEEARIVVV